MFAFSLEQPREKSCVGEVFATSLKERWVTLGWCRMVRYIGVWGEDGGDKEHRD